MERITEKRRSYNTFFTVNERKKCVGKLNTVPFISISHIETKNFKRVKVDDIKIYLNGMGVDLPLMGMDQFIGDQNFLNVSPEDKVEYIKKFSMLLSKRYDIVLVD